LIQIFSHPYRKYPLISIIIPTHNCSDVLAGAINSVTQQYYQQWELIIVDGGSSDGTLEIIKNYQDHISQWVSEPDGGIYDAMNKGVKVAKGDWIYFLGADDILVNILHKISPQLRNSNRIYYGNVYMPNKNIFYDGKFSANKLMNKNICHQAIFYPRTVFEKYEYSLKYPRGGDWDLNMRLWGDPSYKFSYLPFLIAIFSDIKICRDDWDNYRDLKFEKDRIMLAHMYMGRQLKRSDFLDGIKKKFVSFWYQ